MININTLVVAQRIACFTRFHARYCSILMNEVKQSTRCTPCNGGGVSRAATSCDMVGGLTRGQKLRFSHGLTVCRDDAWDVCYCVDFSISCVTGPQSTVRSNIASNISAT